MTAEMMGPLSPMETEHQRLSPDPESFPKLVEKLKTLGTTDFAWPEDDLRGIAAPTLIVLGDSDGVRLEHASCRPAPGCSTARRGCRR